MYTGISYWKNVTLTLSADYRIVLDLVEKHCTVGYGVIDDIDGNISQGLRLLTLQFHLEKDNTLRNFALLPFFFSLCWTLSSSMWE